MWYSTFLFLSVLFPFCICFLISFQDLLPRLLEHRFVNVQINAGLTTPLNIQQDFI